MFRLQQRVIFLAAGLLFLCSAGKGRPQDATAPDPTGNLIQNGDFSEGIGKWRTLAMGTAKASKVVEDTPTGKALHISVTQGSSQPFHVELQADISNIQATKYKLSFKVKSLTATYITVKLMVNHKPYTTIWNGTGIETAPDWKTYAADVSITAPLEETSVLVIGGMGSSVNDYWVSDFSLVKSE